MGHFFKKSEEPPKGPRSFEEKLKIYLEKAAQISGPHIAETGPFQDYFITFDLEPSFFCKTAGLRFSPAGSHGPGGKALAVYVLFPDDSGRVMKQFIFKDSKEELMAFLVSGEGHREILASLRELDESVRKHD